MSRGVITLALGRPFYFQLAVNLARSFSLWHRTSDLGFALATDSSEPLPADLAWVQRVPFAPGTYAGGFSAKLNLDRLTPFDRTLFVDADCLCFRSLEPVFAAFAGRPVAVTGGKISSGEWFGQVETVRKKFGLAALPKFNGGLYYLEKGPRAEEIYATARLLEPHYDELGLVRMRGQVTDELLMSLALALHEPDPLPDDGSILSDPQACPGPMRIDLLSGHAELLNPPAPDPRHVPWYPHTRVRPTLVHFLGHHVTGSIYGRETRLLTRRHWPRFLARAYTALTYFLPLETMIFLKNLFRPIYRLFFGYRKAGTHLR